MSVSVKLTNSECNNACVYCYEKVIRQKGRDKRKLDLDAVLKQIEYDFNKLGPPVYVHGGDPLLADIDVLEKILAKGYELGERTGIQVYPHNLTDEHIKLFEKYSTHVGCSIDGPYPLNKARNVPGKDPKQVWEDCKRNLLKMRDKGVSTGIICILSKYNTLPEPRKKLKDWLLWLESIGISGGRLNPAVNFADDGNYALTPDEMADAWVDLLNFTVFEIEKSGWKPFRDVFDSLLGNKQGTCIFDKCRYYHARTEPVVLSDGKTAGCFKVGAMDGHIYPRYPDYQDWNDPSKRYGMIRYDILPQVEYKDGGCKGCKFWRNCTGGCAGAAIDRDWRNRAYYCKAYYALLEEGERLLKAIMPNVVLATDGRAEFDGDKAEDMITNPFRIMDKRNYEYPAASGSPRGEKRNQQKVRVRKVSSEEQTAGHNDGVEHLDGNTRHLDSSDPAPGSRGHTDGIEHLDGNTRHSDSDGGCA